MLADPAGVKAVTSAPARSKPRQGHPALAHIFAGTVLVTRLATFIALEEQELAGAFIGVDFRRTRGGVGKFQRHMPPPSRLERGDVDADPAPRIGRFARPDPQNRKSVG